MTGLDHKIALRYIFGGQSEFTIYNEQNVNNDKYCYSIKHQKDSNIYFVRYFVNSKFNKRNEIYAGYFKKLPNGQFIYVQGKNGRLSENSKEIKPLLYTVSHLNKKNLSPSVIIKHNGKCALCGKRLTDEKSVVRGFGSYCWSTLEVK